MEPRQYRKISTGRGQQIRDLMGEATGDPRDLMGRRELNERLAEIFPEEDLRAFRDALGKKFEEAARATAAGGDRFEMRGKINHLALEVVEGIEKLDRIVEPEGPSDEDVSAAVDGAGSSAFTRAARAVLEGDQS